MKRTVQTIVLALLAAIVFISCDPGPAGIFSLLELEEPLDKGTTVFNENTAQFVLRFGTDYYAAVGSTLLTRPAAGGTWTTVAGAPSGYNITSGVVAGDMYILSALSPDRVYTSNDGITWTAYGNYSLVDPGETAAYLLAADNQLFLVTKWYSGTSTSDYATHYAIYWDNAGTFTPTLVTDEECGLPASIAYNNIEGRYWITAGNTIFTGTTPAGIDSYGFVPTGVTTTNPVFSVVYDSGNNMVIASATGYLYSLTAGAATASDEFGSSDRRLSSVVVVPANTASGATNAVVVGVKPWTSDDYMGYYEYDAADNASFATVAPDTAYTLISTNSNYVTTLDDLSIEGFYYDSLGQRLFARTVRGGLWSNSYSGGVWSGWNRE